jgi:hypothetical protein
MAPAFRELIGLVLIVAILAVSARASISRRGARKLRRWAQVARPERWPDRRDPERAFTKAQRMKILRRADWRCEWVENGERCRALHGAPGVALEADHVIPWAAGGATIVRNGQALCGPHNRSKSDRVWAG